MTPVPMPPGMALALQASFGSVQASLDELLNAAGGRAARHQLVFMPQDARLLSLPQGTPEPGGCVHLLGLDLGGEGDVQTRLDQIDWAAVYQRYQQAVHAAGEGLAAQPHDVTGVSLLDVRRSGVFEEAETMLPGASWRDPAQVGAWGPEWLVHGPVVVYCVHGHEVSRATALRLRAMGVPARYLAGGIEAWTGAGYALAPKRSG
jgi:Fe-Mn family superoxide dismutase